MSGTQGGAPRARNTRSIKVGHRRTTIDVEPYYVTALEEICRLEGLSFDELCTMLKRRLARLGTAERSLNLSAALRLYAVAYFRAAATDDGHARAGHGRGRPLEGTPLDNAGGPAAFSLGVDPSGTGPRPSDGTDDRSRAARCAASL